MLSLSKTCSLIAICLKTFVDIADVYASLAKLFLTSLTGLKGKNKLHSTAFTLIEIIYSLDV